MVSWCFAFPFSHGREGPNLNPTYFVREAEREEGLSQRPLELQSSDDTASATEQPPVLELEKQNAVACGFCFRLSYMADACVGWAARFIFIFTLTIIFNFTLRLVTTAALWSIASNITVHTEERSSEMYPSATDPLLSFMFLAKQHPLLSQCPRGPQSSPR